jgi:hypothetical protein
MDLVFELPSQGLLRHRRGQTEQDAAIKLEGAGAKIMHYAKQLRSNAMILLVNRSELA